jgi:hypothetical protein
MHNFYSQIGQDKWVAERLNYKRNGTFLDIGCHHYSHLSNTFFFEKDLGWTGIGIELDETFKKGWEENRKSPFICHDATTLDYKEILEKYNMPKVIDYLNVDLEPPSVTLKALEKLFETDYIFNVVTFEIDGYRQTETIKPSRQLLSNRGYVLIKNVNNQDDYYVHARLYNSREIIPE